MTRANSTPRYLFQQWDDISERIRASPRVALLSDFDGTLARIAAMPHRVRLSSTMRSALQALAKNKRATLAVISGRRRNELQHFIGVQKMEYLGLYGWERKGNARSTSAQSPVTRMYLRLLNALVVYPGVWLEPKQFTISVHFLGTSARVQRQVRQTVKRLLSPARRSLRVMQNLHDLEIVPAVIKDKGAAIRQFLRAPSLRHALPIYFGDDLSDEPAFRVVRPGISVLVGKVRRTQAEFYLREPAEVTAAIAKIERALE